MQISALALSRILHFFLILFFDSLKLLLDNVRSVLDVGIALDNDVLFHMQLHILLSLYGEDPAKLPLFSPTTSRSRSLAVLRALVVVTNSMSGSLSSELGLLIIDSPLLLPHLLLTGDGCLGAMLLSVVVGLSQYLAASCPPLLVAFLEKENFTQRHLTIYRQPNT